MRFDKRIQSIQKSKNSLLCIGLDPDLPRIPGSVRRSPDPAYVFSKQIIKATSDLACAYKFNLAFFEANGTKGYRTLEKLLTAVPDDILVILDGKRGDIGNSAKMYARALFHHPRVDAVTVSPYMGTDSVLPFLERPEKGAFVLVLTSNSGATDFQSLRARGKPLYEHVATRARIWNRKGNCGLVVGATRPAQLRRIRSLAPTMPILVPGVGAQGGDLREAVRNGCTTRGDLAIINVGRSILFASPRANFAEKARETAERFQAAMQQHRSKYFD